MKLPGCVPAAPDVCPGCGTPLEGLGTFCWGPCRRPVHEIEAELAGAAPAVVAPGGVDLQEKEIREAIVGFFETVGWMVVDLEQGGRLERCVQCNAHIPGGGSTRVVPGLADLLLIPPAPALFVFAETKRALTGKKGEDAKRQQRPDQVVFQARIEAMGHEYVLWRSLEEAVTWFKGRSRC